MSRFMHLVVCAFALVFIGMNGSFAAACSSSKTYTSCKAGRYLNEQNKAGNSCLQCPTNSTSSEGNTNVWCNCKPGYQSQDGEQGRVDQQDGACQAVNYQITYNLNGGSGCSNIKYTIESATFTLCTPTRAGYTFGGWYTSSSLTGSAVTQVAKGSTGNKPFYAKWTACTPCSTTYANTVNCSVSVSNNTCVYTTSCKPNYTSIANNGKYNAYCRPKIYTITLNKNGGTGGTDTIYEVYGLGFNNADDETISSITKPTRTGYAFTGYYTSTSGGTQIIDANGKITDSKTYFTKDTTIYAHWEAKQYTITANYAGGTGSLDWLYEQYGSAFKYSANNASYDTSITALPTNVLSTIKRSSVTTNYITTSFVFNGFWSNNVRSYIGSSSGTLMKRGYQYINAAGTILVSNTYFTANSTMYAQWNMRCPAGSYLPAYSETCTVCEQGYYCPGGTYRLSSGIQGRNSCGTTATSNAGSSSVSACKCKAGYEGNASTSSGTCTACQKGHYKSTAGNTTCTAASIGYYVSTTAATSQTQCSANRTTTGTGSTAATDCLCAPGAYLNGSTCSVCSANTYKSTIGSTASCTSCISGYTTTGTSLSNHDEQSDCKKTITLNKNGGTGTIQGTSGTANASIICSEGQNCDFGSASVLTWSKDATNKPTNTAVGGWSTSDLCYATTTSFKNPAADTYYACKTYRVDFDMNGGTGTTPDSVYATLRYKVPENSTLTTPPTRTGYTFGGWYNTSASTGGNLYYTADGTPNRIWLTTDPGTTTTLYARWTPNIYTITLYGITDSATSFTLTGEPVSGHIYEKYATGWYSNSTATTAISSVKVPTWDGFTFLGYYEDPKPLVVNNTSLGAPVISKTGALPVNTTFTDDAVLGEAWAQNCKIQPDSTKGTCTLTVSSAGVVTYSATCNTGYTLSGNGTSTPTCTGVQSTVSFNLNGGSSNKPNNVTATYGSDMPALSTSANPYKTGHSFYGWFDSATGGKQYYTYTRKSARKWDKTASSATLYARFYPNETYFAFYKKLDEYDNYEVSYNIYETYGDGWFNYETGEDITSIPVPEREGYTFIGYYDRERLDNNSLYEDVQTTTTIESPTFNTGVLPANTTYEDSDSIEVFEAWAKTCEIQPAAADSAVHGTCTTTVTPADDEGYINVNYNVECLPGYSSNDAFPFPSCEANTYLVFYNKNNSEATGTTTKSVHTYNEAKALTLNGYSLSGYTFNRWTTAADGTGTKYTNGQTVKNLTAENDAQITLYAQWCHNCANVPNGSCSLSVADGTCKYTTSCNPGYNISGNGTYNPTCKNIFYTITYKAGDGGSGNDQTQTVSYNTKFTTKAANTFTKANATFAGWSASSGGYTNAATEYTYTTVGNVTLTATWNCNAGYTLNSTTKACDPCTAGTYKSAVGNGTCSACTGRAKYSGSAATKCTDVSIGYYTTGCNASNNNCTGQSQCTGATYCSDGIQNNCPAQTSGWTRNSGTGWSAVTQCNQTKTGTSINTNCSAGVLTQNAINATTWGDAKITTSLQAKPGAYVNGQTCTACSDGTYSAGGAKTSCDACSALPAPAVTGGTFTSVSPRSASTNCRYKAPTPEKPLHCETKTSNTISYSGTAWGTDIYSVTAKTGSIISGNNTKDATCTQCQAGTVSAGGTATTCATCAPGTYTSTAGQSSCAACPAGKYCTGGTNVTNCAVGTYRSATGGKVAADCSACSALTGVSVSGGTYTSAAGSTANTACKYTAPDKAITGCKTVTTNTVTYSGTAWPATTYNVTANGGYIIANNGAAGATCTQCTGAKYSAGGTATTCETCPGTYTANTTNGKSNVNQCQVSCTAGYAVQTANEACKIVASGYQTGTHKVNYGSKTPTATDSASPAAGTWYSCLTNYSASGTTAADHDARSDCKISCGAGTRIASPNATSCTTPAGNWWIGAHTVAAGSSSPVNNCNTGYAISGTAATNHDAAADCGITCNAGYYIPTAGGGCKVCTAGKYCTGGTKNQTETLAVTGSCPAGTYSTGGATSSACTAAVSGYTAAVCAANKYSDAGASSCTDCATAKGYTNSGTTAAAHAGIASCRTSCKGDQYVASAGAGCVTVGEGYYGREAAATSVAQNATLARTQCPAGYRNGAATTVEANCAMSVAGGKYVAVAKESAASGTCAAGYAKAAHTVTYGNTSSCAACTGATYAANTGQASCTTCPAATNATDVSSYGYYNKGGTNDHTVREGCYAIFKAKSVPNGSMTGYQCYIDKDTNGYGLAATGKSCWVNTSQLKCNGGYYNAAANGGATQPSASTLENLWNNACIGVGVGYWSGANSLTRTQCATGLTTIGYGAGADEAADCGRVLHVGDTKLYLRSTKKTTPSLNVKIGNTTFYGNMSTATKGTLRINSGGTKYSVHDDSM